MTASGPPSNVSSPVDGGTGERMVASGKSLIAAPVVRGRDTELARLGALLGDARAGRSGALLVQGEPGIGKTTLLDSARSLAGDFTVLSVTGVESESVLAHAGLFELLHPLRELLSEIPDAQAAALGSALGWTAAEVPADRFLVSAATLSLLAAAAERAPVLVVVDDLQWVDSESAAAVLFAARRLGPDAVAFVISARTGSVSAGLVAGLPVVELAGLSAEAASGLVPPGTTETVVDRLVDGTQGNPLAVLEVAQRLTPAQRLGVAPLPDPLPVGEHLAATYGQLLSGLSAVGRRALLLLATDTSTATTTTESVLATEGADPAAVLDEARERGILVGDEHGLRFRHPLLRTAVLRRATPAQRRDAHLTLSRARGLDDRARVWHRAAATAGIDDRLADDLAAMADMDRFRLGYAAASGALERSAQFTSDPGRAAERLAAATEDAFMAGDMTRTRDLVGRVLAGSVHHTARGRALFIGGMLEQYAGSVPRSIVHLTEACELLHGVLQVRALTELALARFRLNDLDGIAECATRADAVADLSDPEQRLLASFTTGLDLLLRGEVNAGRAKLAEAKALGVSEDLRHDPRALMLTAVSIGVTGEMGDEVALGMARLEDVRRRGAVGVLVPTLALLAAGRAWVGDHAGAFADAGEAAELAEQIGYAADAALAVEMLAWQSAARGLHDDASRALTRARALTDRAGTTSVAAHQAITAAFCALCRGDITTVVSVLESRIAADGGLGAAGEPLGVAPVLVEAYVALGRIDDAVELTRRYAEIADVSANPMTTAFVRRCQGMTVTEEASADAAFECALIAHGEAGDVFEAARTRLLYGARLRRQGQRVAAREQLRTAHDAFTEMDLTLWSRAADQELAATGARVRRRGVGAEEPLSSQETRVALMVAKGMPNREVAAALFLSPKTVERHLSSIFRKRGFRSRTELAAAYARRSVATE
jgi:DNA-binding CsgD family transcriptional regulator